MKPGNHHYRLRVYFSPLPDSVVRNAVFLAFLTPSKKDRLNVHKHPCGTRLTLQISCGILFWFLSKSHYKVSLILLTWLFSTTEEIFSQKNINMNMWLKKKPSVPWPLTQQFDELFWGPPVFSVLSQLCQKKKVWNKSADPSGRNCVPRTICTRGQKRPTLSTSERIKGGICLADEWCFCYLMQMICAGVFASQINIQNDMFLSFAGAGAETETSLLLTRLVINPFVCHSVMTPNTNPSDLSHTGLS